MLDIKFIRENKGLVSQAIKDKMVDLDLNKLLKLDEKRREFQHGIDEQRAELKKSSKAKPEPDEIKKLKKLSDEIKTKQTELEEVEAGFRTLMLLVPNIPSKDTLKGGEKDFKIIDTWGDVPKFDFDIKDHIELGNSLNLFDLERGVKVAGFRGYFLKNEGLLLQMALMNLALEKLVKKGFTPMQTPTMVKEFALVGSGHFPTGREEIYEVEEFSKDKEKEHKYLVGTAEPSLLAYHADEVLDAKQLPIKLCGISPCFRREVGGYGKDTRGLYRVHEFMKVEQVVICENNLEQSEVIFQELNQTAREFLQELELPHRVIQIATGDMGAGKYKMYDIETWFAGKKAYGETHSNSNLTDWQARRLNIRYRDKNETKFVYTLNNTMIASPRILIAILENNQQKDGSIKIPKVLQNYLGKKIISK